MTGILRKFLLNSGGRFLIIRLFITLIIFSLMATLTWAQPKVFYGKVVGIEFFVIQVRGDNGKVSVFWMGHRTHLDSKVPFFGDRVKIEYIKDGIGRNAVTQIAILRQK